MGEPTEHKGRRRFLSLMIIAAMSLLIRLAPLARDGIGWSVEPDSLGYIHLADGLVAGCGFAREVNGRCGSAEVMRTPGYPLFLAVLPGFRCALALQAFLSAGIVLLVGLVTRRWMDRTGAWLTATIIGFDVPSVIASNTLLTETLFTFLVTCALLLQLQVLLADEDMGYLKAATGMTVAAILVGVAAFVRPIGEALILAVPLPALLLFRLSRSQRLSIAVLAVSVPLLMINCWSFRNHEQRGIWTFSTIAALNTYYYRAAGVLAYDTGRDFSDVRSELIRSTGGSLDELSPVATEKLAAQGRAILRNHLQAFCAITFKGLLRTAFGVDRTGLKVLLGCNRTHDSSERQDSEIGRSNGCPWLISLLVHFELALLTFSWLGVALALVALPHSNRKEVTLIIIALMTAGLLLIAAAGPEGYDRFRVPAVPMLAIVAGLAWSSALSGFTGGIINTAHD